MSKQSPWRNENRLREMYFENKMSMPDIADELGCSFKTIYNWMEHFGIERRSLSEGVRLAANKKPASFMTDMWGYESWRTSHKNNGHKVRVHRLVAVAVWGFDEVSGKVVHHKNNISWDNRPENLQTMTRSEHSKGHAEGNL